jgi:hypothetical protein
LKVDLGLSGYAALTRPTVLEAALEQFLEIAGDLSVAELEVDE